MENKLTKKYGLLTAICMVVGIVIGSGVFFKAQTVLQKTGGDMPLGIIAWIIGGLVMIFCVLAFGSMAQKYEKVNGIVDYAEATIGKKYGYLLGWFLTTIYYPTMTVALAWLSARYSLEFIRSVAPDFPLLALRDAGGAETILGPECIILTLFFLVAAYAMNALSPKIAGKFQVSTTFIKLIPLCLMAVVGIIYGLVNGTLANNFANAAEGYEVSGNPLFAAVCSTVFAYEGWIIATSINAELKDSKKNLPKALTIGGIIIMAILRRCCGRSHQPDPCRQGRNFGLHQRIWKRSRKHIKPLYRNFLHGNPQRSYDGLQPWNVLAGSKRQRPRPRNLRSG